jgi:2Fe-2S ferredoxin
MKIKFQPTGQEIDGNPNKTLLQLCAENNIEIKSICKGVPSCAECRVKIVAGENNLVPPNRAELGLIGTNYFLDGRRLACQVRCFGNITVDLTEQIERADAPSKKVRGFRTQQGRAAETQAVQGTLVLEEKPVKKDEKPGKR